MADNSFFGWGGGKKTGLDIRGDEPAFSSSVIGRAEWQRLSMDAPRYFLYRSVLREAARLLKNHLGRRVRILEVGSGTGGRLIDLIRLFGDAVQVCGTEMVRMEVDLAVIKLSEFGKRHQVGWFDGVNLPFPDNFFDIVVSKDNLRHAEQFVEVERVLVPGGLSVVFSQTLPGRHALVYKSIHKNCFDISAGEGEFLVSKAEIGRSIAAARLTTEKTLGTVWPNFFLHPEENKFPCSNKHGGWRYINKILLKIRTKLPSWGWVFMARVGIFMTLLFGKFLDSRAVFIEARKSDVWHE